MSGARSLALLALILAVVPVSLGAQQAAVLHAGSTAAAQALTLATPVPSVVLRGPQLPSVPSVRLAPAGRLEVDAPQEQVRAGHDVAMMAVGGTGVAVGLLIGGDSGVLVASVGGVMGLVGLWRYLR